MSGPVRLIAQREVVTRLQQRGYRIGLAVSLLIVVIACVLPSFFGDDNSTPHYDIGLAAAAPGLTGALTAVGKAQGVEVAVHRASAGTARAKVADGKWDAAVVPGGRLLASSKTAGAVKVVQGAYQLSTTVDRLHDAGLTGAQVQRALDVRPLAVHATKSDDDTQKQTIAIITIVLLFSQLVTFCTWVATGVVEEKASRVVELILSSVRPVQLLAGKLLGIGALAAGQVLALGVVGLVAGSAAGTLTVPASGIVTVAVAFVAFLLGFAFFAALAAGLGSTVSRQEEVSGVLTPVTVTIMVCYLASFSAANSPGSTLSRVVSIVPPFSSIAMPARIARGGVAVLDVVLAVVLLVLAAAAVVAVAARVYRASVLHSGTRVPLKRAWRGEAVSELS